MNVLTAYLKKNEQKASLDSKGLSVSVSDKINVTQITGNSDHDKLNNLDYERSGHTGFASEARLNAVEQATVPKRLDALPVMDNMSNRETAYLYVDNNGKSEKISIRQALADLPPWGNIVFYTAADGTPWYSVYFEVQEPDTTEDLT